VFILGLVCPFTPLKGNNNPHVSPGEPGESPQWGGPSLKRLWATQKNPPERGASRKIFLSNNLIYQPGELLQKRLVVFDCCRA